MILAFREQSLISFYIYIGRKKVKKEKIMSIQQECASFING